MTDEEIKKDTIEERLARRADEQDDFLAKDALDYINRLKASDDSKEKCTIEQRGEIHRLRNEVRRWREENENMYGEIMNLRAYIDNHEEIWKHNAEIDKAIVRKDTAKEILRHFPHNKARDFFCKKFGVEVDDE